MSDRDLVRYGPHYWGAVFPLGMYTVCTFRLSIAIDAAFLVEIPRVFVFVSVATWALVAFGMVLQIVRRR